MLIKSSVQRWMRGCALLCAPLLAATAFAGIPEPGIVLRGKVFDSNDNLVTSGTLQWTFTPQGTGDAVLLTTPLEELGGDGGPYSYQVLVPLETRVSGFPDNARALPINSTATYRREAEVLNTTIRQSATNITVSLESRGRVIRADVGFQDDDEDGLPDDWEITHFGNLGQGPDDDFPDMDGLNNAREYELGTDPTKADTDDDGFTDAEEVANGTDPTVPTPTFTSVSPNRAWLFGGAVAHITGRGFITDQSSVLFNGVAATMAPGFTSTNTDLYVLVPPLEDVPLGAGDEVEVDVTVANPSNQNATGDFTYIRYLKAQETSGGATGSVTTNAYTFDRAQGSGNLTVVLDGDNPDNTGVLNIPATGNLGTGTVFAIVRATQTPPLAGITGFPGTAIADVWNFTIHLYDDEPTISGDELSFTEYSNIAFAEGGRASLTFPIDNTNITGAEVEAGDISLFSIASNFDFTLGATAHTLPGGTPEGQYTVLPTDLVNDGNSVTVQMSHFSAFSLRRGAGPIDPVTNEVQTLTIDATGGTFTLTFNGQTTGPIDFDVTAEELQAILEGLSTIGDGNVSVVANGDGTFSITFLGTLAGQDVPEMTGDDTALTGGSGLTLQTAIDGDQASLVVSPSSRIVGAEGGSVEFAVSNGGDTPIDWAAEIQTGDDFLAITSGATGTDAGTVTISVAANTTDSIREGTFRVRDTAGDEAVSVTIAQNSPTARPTLMELAETLLSNFADADGDGDGMLSFDEARSIIGDLTQEEFNQMAGDDEFITQEELDAIITGPEPCEGCNCPDGGGCAMSKAGIVSGVEKALGDFFLFGITILTLLALSGRRTR